LQQNIVEKCQNANKTKTKKVTKLKTTLNDSNANNKKKYDEFG